MYRRPCGGAIQPLLTLRLCYSPSDELIIFIFNLALVLFLSTLDDDAGCPVWDPGKPKREPSETNR
jgi:hypothetical protein